MEAERSFSEVAIPFPDVSENLPVAGLEVEFIPLNAFSGHLGAFGIVVERVSPSYDSLIRRFGYFEIGRRSLLARCSNARLLAII